MTRIVHACAGFRHIESLEIRVRKTPVNCDTGALGVRLTVDRAYLNGLR